MKPSKIIDNKAVLFPSADLINFRFDQNDIAISKLDSKLDSLLGRIVTPKDMADAKAEATISYFNITNRISKLEKWNEWLVRLVGGAIILTVLATIGIKSIIKG